MSGRFGLRALVALAVCLGFTLAEAADAAPAVSLHNMTWYVHEDLIDATHDLAYYQQLLSDRLAEAEVLLKGGQGPVDTPCCVAFEAATVTTFSGAGLDIIETQQEVDAVLDGPAGAYLVDSVWFCNSFNVSIVGCANIGGDSLVVSLDAEDSGLLPLVITHEVGHNAGRYHANSDPCEVMSGSRGGGCLDIPECQAFAALGTPTAESCSCHDDTLGNPALADASACTDDFGSGLCSGAVCGESTGPAGTRMLTVGASDDPTPGALDDAHGQSPLTGGWEVLGALASGVTATGLAYDGSRDVVFAVSPQGVGNDQLITLDPVTGAQTATVATLGYTGLQALAYDPAGDRLFAIQADSEIFGNPYGCSTAPCISALLEIDPDDGATTFRGELNTLIVGGGVQGLAWDSTDSVLYGSTAAGLFSIGTSCGGGACSSVTTIDNAFRRPSSLAYDETTDTLYRQGQMLGRTEFDVIDPTSGATVALIGTDGLEAGGMAVIPVPEPARWLMLASGAGLLSLLGRRRAKRRD